MSGRRRCHDHHPGLERIPLSEVPRGMLQNINIPEGCVPFFFKATGTSQELADMGIDVDDPNIRDMELNERGVPMFTEAHRVSDDVPFAENPFGKMMTRIVDCTTMKREAVVAQFWENSRGFQRASSLKEMEDLRDNLGGDIDRYYRKSKGTAPFVEIKEENRIDIRALRSSFTDRQIGKFLLCRTITPAVNGVWVEVAVEDPKGKNTAILRLNNFTPPKYSTSVGRCGGFDFLGILPPGSFLAVKNPYGIVAVAREPVVLKVDCYNPADVVVFSAKKIQEMFPDLAWCGSVPSGAYFDSFVGMTDVDIVEALKRKGTEALALKRYTDSIRCFDLGLDYVTGGGDREQFGFLWINKAAAFLGLGCFSEGLEACDSVLQQDPDHVKAIVHKVNALVGLGRSAEAKDFLNGKLTADSALKENEDLKSLMSKIPPPGTIHSLVDIYKPTFNELGAEYVGPIELRHDPSTGQSCVFATADMELGDTIFVKRCFADVAERLENEGVDEEVILDFVQTELIGLIANKIAFSPELGREFYSMWAGKKLGSLKQDSDNPNNAKVNLQRIRKIVNLHSRFGPKKCADVTAGVSELRHSCADGNVIIHHSKGWIHATATKSITKGQEITTHLVNVGGPLETRKKDLKKLGRSCNCRLCQRDARDSFQVKEKFVRLWYRLREYSALDYDSSRHKVDTSLAILDKLSQLRKDAPDLDQVMLDCSIRIKLCQALFRRGMYDEYIDICKNWFRVAETLNYTKLVHAAAIDLMRGYLKLQKLDEAMKWARTAKKYSHILYGSPLADGAWSQDLLAEMNSGGIDMKELFDK